MKKIQFLILAVLALTITGCGPKYFTENLRKSLENQGISLQSEGLKFYTDRDMEIKRVITQQEAKLLGESNKSVRFENNKFVEYVLLTKGTSGVCTKSKDGVVYVTFDEGDNKELYFGKLPKSNNDTPYEIFADEYRLDGTGRIEFDGKTFFIQHQPGGTRGSLNSMKNRFRTDNENATDGTETKLMIKMNIKNNYQQSRRKMTGR